jgi:hypothetical protein
MTKSGVRNSTTSNTTPGGELSGAGGLVEVCFITPDPNGIHGEPEITTFPISDRENTLEKLWLLQAAMIWLRMA